MAARKNPSPPPATLPEPAPLDWRIPDWAALAILLLYWAQLGWSFYRRRGWIDNFEHWKSWPTLIPALWKMTGPAAVRALALLAGLAGLVALGASAGRTLLRRWNLWDGEPIERFLLALSVGWGLGALVLLGLGLLGLWSPAIFLTAAGLAAVGAAFDWRRSAAGKAASYALPAASAWSPWERCAAGALTLLGLFNLFGALMPEIFYDALVYHLALPGIYWKRGGIVATPDNLYSGLPLLIQMLYGAALPLGGDALARLVNWLFGVGTAGLCFSVGSRYAGRGAGLLGALLYYSVPLAGVLSWKCGVEPGWGFFQLAAVAALARRVERPEGTPAWTALGGLLAGLAMGTKYQAWPMAFILGAGLAWTLPGEPRKKIRETGVFLAVAALATAPWIFKNALLYGNPLYPFFHERLGDFPPPRWQAFLQDAEARDPLGVLTTWNGFSSWIRHPWTACARTMDLGPMLLFGLPLLGLIRFKSCPWRLIWAALIGLWGTWSLTSSFNRYLLPHLPLAGLVFAAALERAFEGKIRAILRAGVFFVALADSVYLGLLFKSLGAEPVILGRQAASEYLKAAHPSYHAPSYASVEFINDHLPGSKVLFLGEGRAFHCKGECVAPTIYDQHPLQTWLAEVSSPSDLGRRFQREGLTHLLVNRLELARWQSGPRRSLAPNPRAMKIWQDYLGAQGKPVFEHKHPIGKEWPDAWSVVYALGSPYPAITAESARGRPQGRSLAP